MVAFNKLNPPTRRKATEAEYKLALGWKGSSGLPGVIAWRILAGELLTERQLSVLFYARNNMIDARCRKASAYSGKYSYSEGDDFHESDYEYGAYELAVDWAK
jgi:hypothetical protein